MSMNFGIAITNDTLRLLPQYNGKTDAQLTAKDRSQVALQKRDEYVREATKHLDELKSEYGVGISTLCRFYNASGDRIRVKLDHNWRGSFYKDSPISVVENGQWTTFVHVHPTYSPLASMGAVVYSMDDDTEAFIGWQSPWSMLRDPTCHAELGDKGHWWGTSGATQQQMEIFLEEKAKNRHVTPPQASNNYKVDIHIGNTSTCYCVATIERIK